MYKVRKIPLTYLLVISNQEKGIIISNITVTTATTVMATNNTIVAVEHTLTERRHCYLTPTLLQVSQDHIR